MSETMIHFNEIATNFQRQTTTWPPQPEAIAELLRETHNAALDAAVMCCPGGSIVDPQLVADEIRALKV